jgi:hypothetical protein
MSKRKRMESPVDRLSDLATGLTASSVQRMQNLPKEIEFADQVGLDCNYMARRRLIHYKGACHGDI